MMYTLEAYRAEAERALEGTGAFLRVSRDSRLFVSDLPRKHNAPEGVLEKLKEHFLAEVENGLLYLSPLCADEVPTAFLTAILKSAAPLKEKLIRTALAVAMREKSQMKMEFYQKLLKEAAYEAEMERSRMLYAHSERRKKDCNRSV